MTNYEKIKSISIEEMAKLLCDNTNCRKCKFYNTCGGADVRVNGFRRWLESEVKNNG